MNQDVRRYYAHFGEREWARLENLADGRVEFAVTCDALTRRLPRGAGSWIWVAGLADTPSGWPSGDTASHWPISHPSSWRWHGRGYMKPASMTRLRPSWSWMPETCRRLPLQDALPDLLAAESPLADLVLRLALQYAAEPSLLGLANHLLYVGQRTVIA